ncbi:MAG: hypothetical protein PHP14_02290 [Candidatus Pacebacteria bacterium]|nr:hypothetical protein [Candidatus Paceibacterota bacterium]
MEEEQLTQANNKKLPFGIKPFTPFQKKLSIYIVVNLIVLIIGLTFISQFAKEIQITTGMISDFKKNQVGVNVLMEYIAKLERDSKAVKEDFSKYQGLLSDIEDIPTIKKQITNIGAKNRVDPLLNILTLNPAKENESTSYGFVLSLAGRFDNIIKTFKDINALDILITFDQITFEKNLPKNVEKELEQITADGEVIPTTKAVTRYSSTSQSGDIFKVSVIGKIYLKENIKNQENETKQ